MKQTRKRILTILAFALLVGLLLWLFWPRTLESVCGLDFDQVTAVSARLETVRYGNSTDIFTHHVLDGEQLSPSGIKFSKYLLTAFEYVGCRTSLTNLLRPWLLDSFGWAGPVEQLHGFVSCGDTHVHFILTDRGQLIVNNRLYYVNKQSFDTLRHILTTYGTKEENYS